VSVAVVWVSRGGGPVTVRVFLRSQGALVAVVWRFRRPARPGTAVGEISRGFSDVSLGLPEAVDGSGFLVDGYVVPCDEPLPTPYEVVVAVLQGGQVIHQTVPPDQGTGTLDCDEVRFRYPFRLRVTPRGPTR
jgi:hypothetical protein